MSSQFEAMSLESSGAASYTSGNPSDREYLPPEYAIIHWDAHGGKKLTIKMALFCLCLMAAGGEVRHNTSGQLVETLPPDAIVVNFQEPEPAGTDPSGEKEGES
ncbi:hypothetical protein V8C37DRAFT_388331 [Trichoderma ceciliae]